MRSWRWFVSVTSLASSLPMSAAALHPAAGSDNAFCFSMLDHMVGAPGNLVFSPFSVWSALTLVAAGADLETRDQMHHVLMTDEMMTDAKTQKGIEHGLPFGDAHSFIADWSEQIRNTKGLRMQVANHLWANKGLSFHADFRTLAKKSYEIGIDTLDFQNDAAGAQQQIHRWLGDNTSGQIKSLPDTISLTPDTQLVVTSAMSFAGNWVSPFDSKRTTQRDFNLSSGTRVRCNTMTGDISAGYMEDERLQAVRLRYAGMEIAMIVVLPKTADALAGRPFLNAHDFMLVLALMKEEPHLTVQLPKFATTAGLEFSGVLKAAGMTRVFTQEAQFGRLSEQPVSLSRVMHQVALKVTEEGAVANTRIETPRASMSASAADVQGNRFIADHPFLFFIVDERNSGILCAGQLMNPSE